MKKFDNICPGGQIKKIKTLYYIKYPIIDIRKCLYFFDLTTRAEIDQYVMGTPLKFCQAFFDKCTCNQLQYAGAMKRITEWLRA